MSEKQDLLRRVKELEHHFADHAALDRLAKRAPPPAPLAVLHWAWRQLSRAERLQFVTEMLTPSERRALQDGVDEEDNDDARKT